MHAADLHREGVALLADLRRSRDRWSEVTYSERCDEEEDGETYDRHRRLRDQLWLALQYDLADDHELVRDLFEQEVIGHERLDRQGLDEILQLGAYLLTSFRQPADVWLLWRAKRANFDTQCGFDAEYLLASGVAATYRYLESADNAAKSELLDYLGQTQQQCEYSDADIDEWRTGVASYFPSSVDAEPLEALIDRAIEFGTLEYGRTLVDQLESQLGERTASELGQLRRLRQQLGQVELAVVTQRELLAGVADEDHWEVTSATRDLASVLIADAQYQTAWRTLEPLEARLQQYDDWKPCGLGRFVVEAALDIALGASDHALASAALQWSARRMGEGCSWFPILREKGIEAATKVGDAEARRLFENLK